MGLPMMIMSRAPALQLRWQPERAPALAEQNKDVALINHGSHRTNAAAAAAAASLAINLQRKRRGASPLLVCRELRRRACLCAPVSAPAVAVQKKYWRRVSITALLQLV